MNLKLMKSEDRGQHDEKAGGLEWAHRKLILKRVLIVSVLARLTDVAIGGLEDCQAKRVRTHLCV